jgi:hypothetical protein
MGDQEGEIHSEKDAGWRDRATRVLSTPARRPAFPPALQRDPPVFVLFVSFALFVLTVSAFSATANHEPIDVHARYRGACYAAGRRNSKSAPPSGAFLALTEPPWRSMMARTMERPRPLPDGTGVPARAASTL